jgi:hypothetical protein
MEQPIHGAVDDRVAAELRYLGKLLEYYWWNDHAEKAIEVAQLYDAVFCRWYYGKES